MPVQKSIPNKSGVFFITITIYKWLWLIEKVNGYDLVYNWFEHLQKLGHAIIGYVIMPNHIHVIIAFTKSEKSINTIIGNGKRFMAYEIVQRLIKSNKMNC